MILDEELLIKSCFALHNGSGRHHGSSLDRLLTFFLFLVVWAVLKTFGPTLRKEKARASDQEIFDLILDIDRNDRKRIILKNAIIDCDQYVKEIQAFLSERQ
ncbi:unnamed protein product [Prorocentrum cordatum]|uniref:Uncharacterized protein n=1 Tax=Prorocentrum cordatum TaxID=2364126 RepID=A0ABN9XCT5_9DINO|nr:unnamed protein product [Polarella glacialis]